jgi:hypothetical protein
MKELPFKNKIVSIEPMMDFDPEIFIQMLKDTGPVLVHIGYDNYNNDSPEPTLSKTEQVIDTLGSFTRVKTLTLRK